LQNKYGKQPKFAKSGFGIWVIVILTSELYELLNIFEMFCKLKNETKNHTRKYDMCPGL
jgi:hypothetical protein